MQPSLNSFMGKDNHKGLGAVVGTVSKSKPFTNKNSKSSKDSETKRSKKASSNRSGGGGSGFGSPK